MFVVFCKHEIVIQKNGLIFWLYIDSSVMGSVIESDLDEGK